MLTTEEVEKVYITNSKALTITRLIVVALENGLDGFDVCETLEVIRDYLVQNSTLIDKNGL